MQVISFTLTPLSAFGTPLIGDTLFGQLCWAIRNRFGEERLESLLQGYTDNKPFAIVSDAFPEGYLPRPTVPLNLLSSEEIKPNKRKQFKKHAWMPVTDIQKPLIQWQTTCKTSKDILSNHDQSGRALALVADRVQPHNAINRYTGTTGEAEFAPYGMLQTWYQPGIRLQIYLLLDQSRFSLTECKECLVDMGNFGFGRDATIGLGKFSVDALNETKWQLHPQANAVMTLAPVAPQNQGFDNEQAYYQPFTRFGRHGDIAVHKMGKPFKNPVLLAATGAVFLANPQRIYIGQGLGADKHKISNSIEQTVQQGYAPIIGVYLDRNQMEAEA